MATVPRSAGMMLQFAVTIFISAFLLFQLQPLISKYILPWFGGSPAVWTTCLLFFQTVLFAGYAYAHFSEHYLGGRSQTILHLVLLAAALLMLPIAPSEQWKPTGSANPTGEILLLLACCVGLPFFVCSSTGPLIQAWFSRAYPGQSPYRLYSLSNLGSLLALLSYPFVLEPALDVNAQARWWSAAFAFFCILYGYGALRAAKLHKTPALIDAGAVDAAGASQTAPTIGQRLLWLAYPALASMMLSATTNHVCQDVAVIPFLWVVPLSLYLISFIITFDHPRWYLRVPCGLVTLVVIYCAVGVDHSLTWSSWRWLSSAWAWFEGKDLVFHDLIFNYRWQLACHFGALFALCMLCHGELVRCRPAPRFLTSFYLMISIGGALGSLFVSLIAPALFVTYFEWKIGLVSGFLLALLVAFGTPSRSLIQGRGTFRWSRKNLVIGGGLVLSLLALGEAIYLLQLRTGSVLVREQSRNFYGSVFLQDREVDDPYGHDLAFFSGRILHGAQFSHPDQRDWATTYFSEESGVGQTLRHYEEQGTLRIGVIGLGIGTLATYANSGDAIRFYEINPEVCRLADTYFTYLSDARQRGVNVEIALGDARLTIERELKQQPPLYDVLILDAFSGDAPPNHLLTKEAFELYRSYLSPGGAIAVNVTNRYLKLSLVVYAMAKHFGFESARIETSDDYRYGLKQANWIILSKNKGLLKELWRTGTRVEEESLPANLPLWTDQRHNLFEILY